VPVTDTNRARPISFLFGELERGLSRGYRCVVVLARRDQPTIESVLTGYHRRPDRRTANPASSSLSPIRARARVKGSSLVFPTKLSLMFPVELLGGTTLLLQAHDGKLDSRL